MELEVFTNFLKMLSDIFVAIDEAPWNGHFRLERNDQEGDSRLRMEMCIEDGYIGYLRLRWLTRAGHSVSIDQDVMEETPVDNGGPKMIVMVGDDYSEKLYPCIADFVFKNKNINFGKTEARW